MVRAKWGSVVLLWVLVSSVLGWQLAGGTPAYAQEAGGAAGTVAGRVTDTSGAVFAGAEITLQSAQGGAPLVSQSNQDGYFHFTFVGPGDYSLTAEKAGFSDVVIPHLDVQVQQTATVNIVMQPGKVVQEINVSAASTSLQTQTATLSGVVGSGTETALPLPLRDPSGLINLVAGVTNDNRSGLTASTGNQGGLSYQGRLSFNVNGGGRSTAISMVDGVDVTVDAGDFLSVPVVPTPDFTQEFTVQTNNQPAQFGRRGAEHRDPKRHQFVPWHGVRVPAK
jgi:Carboxypeptidase regulatory-like domain